MKDSHIIRPFHSKFGSIKRTALTFPSQINIYSSLKPVRSFAGIRRYIGAGGSFRNRRQSRLWSYIIHCCPAGSAR